MKSSDLLAAVAMSGAAILIGSSVELVRARPETKAESTSINAAFRPGTDVDVSTDKNSVNLKSTPKRRELPIPTTGRDSTPTQAEAGNDKAHNLNSAPDCAGGICTIYLSREPRSASGFGDTSDQLHVKIASVPTTNGTKSFDLIGTKGNLDSDTIAAFDGGGDDFKPSGTSSTGSNDPLATPDDSAYWQMR